MQIANVNIISIVKWIVLTRDTIIGKHNITDTILQYINIPLFITFKVYNLEMESGNLEIEGLVEGDNWCNYIGADTIRWMMKGTRGMKGTKGMDCILRCEEIELPR